MTVFSKISCICLILFIYGIYAFVFFQNIPDGLFKVVSNITFSLFMAALGIGILQMGRR